MRPTSREATFGNNPKPDGGYRGAGQEVSDEQNELTGGERRRNTTNLRTVKFPLKQTREATVWVGDRNQVGLYAPELRTDRSSHKRQHLRCYDCHLTLGLLVNIRCREPPGSERRSTLACSQKHEGVDVTYGGCGRKHLLNFEGGSGSKVSWRLHLIVKPLLEEETIQYQNFSIDENINASTLPWIRVYASFRLRWQR